MKQKIFSLLTLALLVSSGAWASQTELISGVTLPDIPSATLDMASQTDFTPDVNGWIVFGPSSSQDNVVAKSYWNGTTNTTAAQWTVPDGAIAPFNGNSGSNVNVLVAQQTSRTHAFRFTGAESASFLVSSGGSRTIYVALYSYDGETQTQVTGSPKSTGNSVTELLYSELSTTTNYIAYIYESTNSNGRIYEVALKAPTTPTKVSTPTFTPNGATFTTSQSVTLACATDDSSIYYTTDGTTPSKTNGTLYSSAINLTSSTTIKAIAVDDNETLEDSEVATATFTKVISTPWNSWYFTSWSSATETGVLGDATNWDDSEKGGSGLDWSTDNKGRSNKTTLSGATLTYGSTTITETDGLEFTTSAANQIALLFDLGSTDIGTYNGSKYIWLYGKNSQITIPDVPAGATVTIGIESHKTSESRQMNVSNASPANASVSTYEEKSFTVSADGDVTISPNGSGMHIYSIAVTTNVETVPVKTNASRNYGTMVTPAGKKLDFSAVADDVKAYISPGLNAGKTAISIQSVGVVPGNTPIIIKTTTQGATVDVPVTIEDADDIASINKLVAGDGSTDATPGEYTYFYIASDQFHRATSGTLKSGKAYLKLETASLGHELSFGFDESESGDVTGIKAIENSQLTNDNFYDLQGRKVAQPTKGLYIVNGRKVIIK